MEISSRLKTVANTVKYRKMADIGTDHGYVPIYLAQNNKIDFALACDVNKGPLKKAEENILKNKVSHIVTTRLGSGLVPVKAFEVETAVIAGMGGMLTIEILKASTGVVKSLKQLVVSPHIDVNKVRIYLHQTEMKIDSEEFIFDEGKYYTIISASNGEERYEKEIYYAFGKCNLDSKSQVLKKYLEHRLGKLEEIKENLIKSSTEKSLERLKETEEEINLYKEGLKVYEV